MTLTLFGFGKKPIFPQLFEKSSNSIVVALPFIFDINQNVV